MVWTALKEWQIFCDFRDERGASFPRMHTSQAVRAAFVRTQSAGLLPATIPNTSVSALFDLWCKLRVVLESLCLKGAVAPEEGEAAPKGDERDGLSVVHADLALPAVL